MLFSIVSVGFGSRLGRESRAEFDLDKEASELRFLGSTSTLGRISPSLLLRACLRAKVGSFDWIGSLVGGAIGAVAGAVEAAKVGPAEVVVRGAGFAVAEDFADDLDIRLLKTPDLVLSSGSISTVTTASDFSFFTFSGAAAVVEVAEAPL